MRLDLVNFRGIAPLPANSSLLAEWRVGTILQAVAVRDAKSGQLWLDLGGQRHPARVASGNPGPADGERLQVRVLRTHPVLALEALSSVSPEDDASATADALRRFLPRQETPAMMLANLAWLAQSKGLARALPRGVLEAAQRLWQALPDAESLQDPRALQNAVNRSGAFLEANLANGRNGPEVASDLKALMLRLSRAVQDSGGRASAASSELSSHAPPPTARGPLSALSHSPATFALLDSPQQQLHELARQTEGAIARLTTVQIANNGADPAATCVLIELPIKHDERASVLRLRIEQEGGHGHADEHDAWSLEAALDLGIGGALHARVTLSGQRVGVQLRAESPDIVEALAARTDELEALLRQSGLDVDRIVCLHGMPAGDRGAPVTRLLDVHA
jgi:hypothetical protein